MPMTARTPIPISLAALLRAIEDHCGYTHYYLDRETGEIIYQSEHRCVDDTDAAGVPDGPFQRQDTSERFIHVDPMDGLRGIGIMAGFIHSLQDSAVASRLRDALKKNAPYRHFKDTLRDHPGIESRWGAVFGGTVRDLAVEWLRYNNIEFEFIHERETLKHDG
ncbi:MAG: hypothetical protein JXA07_07955 [Spirochaetes bacterium]|nr:hypothetical protein [Spirochaetota bacterium]